MLPFALGGGEYIFILVLTIGMYRCFLMNGSMLWLYYVYYWFIYAFGYFYVYNISKEMYFAFILKGQ